MNTRINGDILCRGSQPIFSLFNPGYPWWIWLGAPAWGMQFVLRHHENSLSLNSPQVELITEAARENDIHVVMGYSEKAEGSLFMGQMIIDRAGKENGDIRAQRA